MDIFLVIMHLQEEHHFTLNPLRTVFYGICEDCRLSAESNPEDKTL